MGQPAVPRDRKAQAAQEAPHGAQKVHVVDLGGPDAHEAVVDVKRVVLVVAHASSPMLKHTGTPPEPDLPRRELPDQLFERREALPAREVLTSAGAVVRLNLGRVMDAVVRTKPAVGASLGSPLFHGIGLLT